MKFLKYGFLFFLMLLINNFLFYKFYQDTNPIPTLPSSESYLTRNYNNLTDSSVLIKGLVPNGEVFGTGIWWKDGYIVTAYHVVSKISNITVSRVNVNTVMHADVYAADPVLDIAIIKISNDDMGKIKDFNPVYLQWANSDEQAVGEPLYILGNPLGIQNTVTEGIMSSTDKIFEVINPFSDYIQTDASMNEGNSGGAIVNSNGRIVGMSDFIYGADRSDGLSFGVRSNDIVNCINQLMATKTPAVHPYLGLYFSFINKDIYVAADPLGPSVSIIPQVDKFISINGRTFTSVKDWIEYEKTLSVGKPVSIVVSRDSKNVTLVVSPVAAPNFMARQQG